MDTLHSGRRSSRVPRTDRGQAQNPSQPVLDRSFCHVACAISNLAETARRRRKARRKSVSRSQE